MASFGSFETEREIYSGSTYTVYSAKKTGDPKTEYAVKLFHISVDEASTEDLGSLVRDLERTCSDRIAVQQRAAAQSRFVAPVIETGQDERGVWYATDFYPRSVHRIISNKVALRRVDLEHVIRSIATGAHDLKRLCGRSHGDILPSVVQISKSAELTRASIVLSDPLPGSDADAARLERSDLRAIGRILLQLVLCREIEREEDFLILPILPTPEWSNLFGKDSARWLALCNRLLDPQLSLDQFNLEQLVAELKPSKKGPPKALITAAAVVFVGGVVAALFLFRSREQTVEVTTDPPGATIFVGDHETRTPLKLKPRNEPYVISAKHPDFQLPDQTTNWTVGPEKVAKLSFKFPYGGISIVSDPPGADIQDLAEQSKSVGKTPFFANFVPAGRVFKYQLVLDQYATNFVHGTVLAAQTNTFSEKLAQNKDTAVVDLDSSPRGAEVFEGERLLSGSKTKTRAFLTKGVHNLTARYLDWPSVTNSIDVKLGQPNSVQFDFKKGWVTLETVSPRSAAVFVGTNWLGDTPLTVPRPPGTTEFALKADGFKATNFVVSIAINATNRVRKEMITENGQVEFTSDPGDAVILDATGKQLGRIAPDQPFRTNFPPGTYSFIARHDGLADIALNSVPLNKGDTRTNKFTFAYAKVSFEVAFGASPADVSISVPGRSGKMTDTFIQPPATNIIYEIAARYYLPTNVAVNVKDHRDEHISVTLQPQPVSVILNSDPPGATFLANKQPLKGEGNQYHIPWGPVTLVAQHRRLDSLSRQVEIQPAQPNDIPAFKFDYGTLLLTNLPSELELREGSEIVAPVGQARAALVYEKPGPHSYQYAPVDRFKPDGVSTNIIAGTLNMLLRPELKGFVSGIGSIQFAWVPWKNGGKWEGKNGPGVWVGIYEITQDQYQKIVGDNPSANKGCPDCPVENVTFPNAVSFCRALTGKDPSPPLKTNGWHYVLPSEELFDYFAKAENTVGGSADLATDKVVSPSFANKLPAPKRVGGRTPNGYQLQDLAGNVSEWIDPGQGTPFVRGANWGTASAQRQNFEYRDSAKDVSPYYGFRILLVPGPE
jgi:hypothetical protein